VNFHDFIFHGNFEPHFPESRWIQLDGHLRTFALAQIVRPINHCILRQTRRLADQILRSTMVPTAGSARYIGSRIRLRSGRPGKSLPLIVPMPDRRITGFRSRLPALARRMITLTVLSIIPRERTVRRDNGSMDGHAVPAPAHFPDRRIGLFG
jgi:hypothetical protein